jgi:HD superfamily phosphodiesterase
MAPRPRPDFAAAVESRFPGLIAAARAAIEESERRFRGPGSGAGQGSYLWEHSSHVAALGFRLALSEKADPVLAAIAGLVHDAGKFAGGSYHRGDRAEEESAAEIAAPLLAGAGMRAADIRRVTGALRALYASGARKSAGAERDCFAPSGLAMTLADIVHDADFLAKFGALGVAQFFIKSTLRGRTLREAMLGPLSKELTYAAGLPHNMRTAAGRRAAAKKSADSLRYFRALLRELRETQALDIRIRRIRVIGPRQSASGLEILLALPRACPDCGGRLELATRTERGLKCEKLEAEIACAACGRRSGLSFCLPELEAGAGTPRPVIARRRRP